jgi:hypothetical protein
MRFSFVYQTASLYAPAMNGHQTAGLAMLDILVEVGISYVTADC